MEKIAISTTINAPLTKVWDLYTNPTHIVKWNSASDDWHTPYATTDLRVGGKFLSRMEAKDGSEGFDFEGQYTLVEKNKGISYVMTDGRKVEVTFTKLNGATQINIMFDAEETNPLEMQRTGWQAILNNFREYAEKHPNASNS